MKVGTYMQRWNWHLLLSGSWFNNMKHRQWFGRTHCRFVNVVAASSFRWDIVGHGNFLQLTVVRCPTLVKLNVISMFAKVLITQPGS